MAGSPARPSLPAGSGPQRCGCMRPSGPSSPPRLIPRPSPQPSMPAPTGCTPRVTCRPVRRPGSTSPEPACGPASSAHCSAHRTGGDVPMTDEREITLTVNRREHTLTVEPRRLLVDVIREDLGLPGTHIGCEHGVCGTCTVLLDGASVRSCITLAVQADGRSVRTVEDLASGGELHPLQEEFWDKQGLQCGYCTPGMLMRAVRLRGETAGDPPVPTEEKKAEAQA